MRTTSGGGFSDRGPKGPGLPPTARGRRLLRRELTGVGVDIEESKDEPYATVQLWSCSGAHAQAWTWGEEQEIKSSSHCLAAKDKETAIGTPVTLAVCAAHKSQQWEWRTSRGTAGRKLRNRGSGLCLGYASQGRKSDQDAPLAIYDCDSDFAREWSYRSFE